MTSRRASAESVASPPPPIRSLAYFRTVALNLTLEERDPAYAEYVHRLYDQLLAPQHGPCPKNRGETPESRGLS